MIVNGIIYLRYGAFILNEINYLNEKIKELESGLRGIGTTMGRVNIDINFNPKIISNCKTPGFARDICLEGNYAFVADNNTMQIIDISDVYNPKIVGECNELSTGIYVKDNFAYISDNILRIPVYPDTDSGNIRTVNPETSGHLVR